MNSDSRIYNKNKKKSSLFIFILVAIKIKKSVRNRSVWNMMIVFIFIRRHYVLLCTFSFF